MTQAFDKRRWEDAQARADLILHGIDPRDRSMADEPEYGEPPTEFEPPPHDYIPDHAGNGSAQDEPQAVAVQLVTPAHWPNEPPPPVEWLVYGRIPRGDVTTLHGDGGAGKTDIAVQLAAACSREAQHWLGHEINGGAIVFLSAEESERDIHRRVGLHAKRDGYDSRELTDFHLWFPDDVTDTALGVADRSGRVQPTPLFNAIRRKIEIVQPVLVIVDNVAATFVGNSLERVHARGFTNLWRSIGRGRSKPAVLLLDHPSLSGITTGTGRGGNMDWRNAVRSALYLRVPDSKAETDLGIRILETAKSNYAAPGNPLRLQWIDGGLAVVAAPSSLHRVAKDAECDETFLRLLDEHTAQGRAVSDNPSITYAPALFAKLPGSNGFTRDALTHSMERLFHARKIAVRQFGPPSKRRSRIERVADQANAEAAE